MMKTNLSWTYPGSGHPGSGHPTWEHSPCHHVYHLQPSPVCPGSEPEGTVAPSSQHREPAVPPWASVAAS